MVVGTNEEPSAIRLPKGGVSLSREMRKCRREREDGKGCALFIETDGHKSWHLGQKKSHDS